MERRRTTVVSGGPSKGHQAHYALIPDLFEDFVRFSQIQYDCLDYDPFHPMIVDLSRHLPREEALWLSTLYMAFYNIGSAYAAFQAVRPLKPLPDWVARLPVGVQRRNLRGGQVVKHLESFSALAKEHGSIEAYLTADFEGYRPADWNTLKINVGKSWGNGRWSVFTTSELYQKANKIPVLPTEIGNDGSSGPLSGLNRMYGQQISKSKSGVVLADQLADKLFERVKTRVRTKIFYLPMGHLDHAMLESELCDFNSLCKGRYYVGRDIDRDQERIRAAEQALNMLGRRMSLDKVWESREVVFDKKYLGEFNGWNGRTKEALQYYQKTGVIADHKTIHGESGYLF